RHRRRPRAARGAARAGDRGGARRAPPAAVKVALLAGGLGGSRFARALTETLEPRDVTVVGNVGDDLEVAGLHVSPDLDTILYTLAGVLDEKKGWGRAGETWNARDAATERGEEAGFQLGDSDLGPHLAP